MGNGMEWTPGEIALNTGPSRIPAAAVARHRAVSAGSRANLCCVPHRSKRDGGRWHHIAPRHGQHQRRDRADRGQATDGTLRRIKVVRTASVLSPGDSAAGDQRGGITLAGLAITYQSVDSAGPVKAPHRQDASSRVTYMKSRSCVLRKRAGESGMLSMKRSARSVPSGC